MSPSPVLDASSARAADGVNLEDGEITANSAISLPRFDEAWAKLTAVRREHHERQAHAAPEGSTLAAWHAGRARGLARLWSRALGLCGSSSSRLRCSCPVAPGARRIVPRGCGRRLACPGCGDDYRRRTYQRVKRSVEWWLARLQGEWASRGGSGAGRRAPTVYMVTLTAPHDDDDPAARARRLDEAWRHVSRGRVEGHWTRPCLAVWEWTRGADGRGHPHLHVIVPAHYVDYALVHGEWRDACLAAGYSVGGRLHVSRPPSRRAAAASAARYASKYVSSADKLVMRADDWAQLAALMRGRRTLRASVGSRARGLPGFWQAWERARCKCCGDLFLLDEVVFRWGEKLPHPALDLPDSS